MNDPFSLFSHNRDLLIAWTTTARKHRSLILPHLEDDTVAHLVRRLLAGSDRLRVRVLRPPSDGPLAAISRWHMDAWVALPEEARRRGVLVAGPTAIHLLGVRARVLCAIAPPQEVGLRGRQMSDMLRAGQSNHAERLSSILNRQTRLLLPHVEGPRDDRPLTPARLARALRRVSLVPIEKLPEVATAVARVLNLDQEAARREAEQMLEQRQARNSTRGLSAEKVKRFMELNRLDASLWTLAKQG